MVLQSILIRNSGLNIFEEKELHRVSISFYFLYSQVEFMLHEEHNTSRGPLSSDAKNASLSANISKVIKIIVFNSQVISTCELVQLRHQKKIIFSSETNDVNQNVSQIHLKIAPANFFFSPYLIQHYFFELFRHLFLNAFSNCNSHTSANRRSNCKKLLCQNLR